jgi:hypothetical protein
MASPDHKRRWAESNPGATAIPSRPPLKKRFTSNINISVASSSSSSASAPSSSTTSPTTANGGGGPSPSTTVQTSYPSTTHSVASSFAKDPEKVNVEIHHLVYFCDLIFSNLNLFCFVLFIK